MASYHLAELARARGHLRPAATLHDEALALRYRAGDLAMTAANHEKAARPFGAAQAPREATGSPGHGWAAPPTTLTWPCRPSG